MEGGLNQKKVRSSETSGFKGKNFLLVYSPTKINHF
jgi:hypothetical protein